MTIGELYDPAMTITDQAEADMYLAKLVFYTMDKWGKSREEAERMARSNLGYYAGYYSNETRERVEKLFNCAHPIFGSIAEKGIPTTEEAFNMGMNAGREKP